jgi:hypothetical protein
MQMTLLRALAFAISFLGASATVAAPQLSFPSVAAGGTILVHISLTDFGYGPLAGIPITLTTLTGCGTFDGAASEVLTTDSTGSFPFTFRAGQVAGLCVMQGENSGQIVQANTTIYQPSDIQFQVTPSQYVEQVDTSFRRVATEVRVSAGGSPLLGIPVTVTAPSTVGGSTAAISNLDSTTNGGSLIRFDLTGNGVVGVSDFVVKAGTSQHVVRLLQTPVEPYPAPDLSGLRYVLPDSYPSHGATTLSIVSGPGCQLVQGSGRYILTGTKYPPGVQDFPLGYFQFYIPGCMSQTVTLRLDFSETVPADGVMYEQTAGGWIPLSGTVTGNSITFTVSPDFSGALFAIAKPGVHQDLPIPSVHDLWWAGSQENGWGMSLAQSADGNLFGAIYGYDDTGHPSWWSVPGGFWNYDRSTFTGLAYSPYGTPWYDFDTHLIAFDTLAKNGIVLRFSDANNATLDYILNSATGHKSVQREIFSAPVSITGIPNVDGMWWGDAAQSGWGIAIIQQYATLFALWYTYDEQDRPTWYVLTGGSWTTSSTYEGRIYRTHGSPLFGHAYDPAQLQVTDVGPYKFTFSGANASLDWTVDTRSGTLYLIKEVPF